MTDSQKTAVIMRADEIRQGKAGIIDTKA